MTSARPSLRPHRDDVLIAVAGLLGGVALWALGLHTQGGRPFHDSRLTLIPLAVMCGAELLRRSRPVTALGIALVAVVADQFTWGTLATILMFTDLMYAGVLYGTATAARWIPRASAGLTVVSTIVVLAVFQDRAAILIGVAVGLITLAPATTGVAVRSHRQAADAARLRAQQTALLAELDRREAVGAERARMARELHDMVANHLSAIAIHATAAQSIDDRTASREALSVIRENSVQGLAEMRRLIGLLRAASDAGGADAAPAAAPTLAGLAALVEQARVNGAASGLGFALDDARDPGAPLPAPVELAAYRIVQESLTNALKHAAPGEVRVALAGPEPLTVAVTSPLGEGRQQDGRPGAGPVPRAPGSGAGLIGMEERVALLGGSFTAGPEDGGAGPGAGKWWVVRAGLPTGEDTTAPQRRNHG
ncbi:chitinase [Streptomyces sp. CNQ-509]|uniref:sensor histidine kinase n=1 Tax=Streptomyces sp. CNQ-509 TaxID=444103 RepID=UPI00062E063F|nr:histidine kinase [Streptomyces sp. CNQ-509]AKH84914.1 chitinase [Streptomyces sp. CNQ-509]